MSEEITPTETEPSGTEHRTFLASMGLQRVGTLPPSKPKPVEPMVQLNARGMPARIRKRNPLFFDDNIINDNKPLRMSLSPKKTPTKSQTPSAFSSPVKTPKRLDTSKSKRKSTLPSKRYNKSGDNKNSLLIKLPLKKDQKSPAKLLSNKRKLSASSTAKVTPKKDKVNRLSKIAARTSSTPESSSSFASLSLVLPTQPMLDIEIGERIGLRLKNLLKLPKAHKWVTFEWFYSFLDKPLFSGPNEFQKYLQEHYPALTPQIQQNLTRAEWRYIRKSMGKPRRCSQAFFEEERLEWERKRQKMRYLQTRRCSDLARNTRFLEGLPDKIPMVLPVGTKVTARLRKPYDGILTARVDGFDSLSSSYRVTFDRPNTGTHTIPDYEIISENFFEMLPLQTITKDFRPVIANTSNYNSNNVMNAVKIEPNTSTDDLSNESVSNVRQALNMTLNKSDPALCETFESPFKNPVLDNKHINGYSVKMLTTILRARRLLSLKSRKLLRLTVMNDEAELTITSLDHQMQLKRERITNADGEVLDNEDEEIEQPKDKFTAEFQRRYAATVISIQRLNQNLEEALNQHQKQVNDFTRDPQVQSMLTPSYFREKCREKANELVTRSNQGVLRNPQVLDLMRRLATVLLVTVNKGGDAAQSAQISRVMDGCIEEVKSQLHPMNVEIFQKNVQIHLHHIRLNAEANNATTE